MTSTATNPDEELENYICSMNDVDCGSSAPPVHVEFETFVSPINRLTNSSSRSQHLSPHHTEQLIVYAAPVIQSQLSARCKETGERLKDLKKEKAVLLSAVSKPMNKSNQQHEDSHQ